ncbi:MAG: 4-hydroxy-tetrahydrodipicolinate reductase, partial [Anaerovoracaceae bacterium]
MIKLIVTAPRGKMDSLIVKEAVKAEDIQLVGCIGPVGRDYIGKDVGPVCGLPEPVGALVYDDIEQIIEAADIVVDFSNRALSMEILAACRAHKKPLICGTTGFSQEEVEKIEAAAKEIPLIKAANTSFMVNVMVKMMELAAEALGDKCKIEILDMHDEKKVDAPSGTALEFAEAMSEASGLPITEMDFHSVRAGDIPSSHTIYFGGKGERIELTHHAYNWECYARGALEGVRFLVTKAAGLYAMND